MNENISQILKNRALILPENIHDLLFSSEFIQKLYSISDVLSVSEEDKTQIRNELLLTLMFFTPLRLLETEIINHTSLGEVKAKDVVKKFTLIMPEAVLKDLKQASQNIIENLPNNEDNKDIIKKVRLEKQADFFANSTETEKSKNNNPDRESGTDNDKEIHDVTPMRTMKGDMQRIHGYGAYRDQHPTNNTEENEPVIKSAQDTVLQKQPLVETPRVDE